MFLQFYIKIERFCGHQLLLEVTPEFGHGSAYGEFISKIHVFTILYKIERFCGHQLLLEVTPEFGHGSA
tara:strand:+ start:125 stop:331 length:207 start_codon:yes stop_codon:yes gene_type:complete